jgi:hypothetical protein
MIENNLMKALKENSKLINEFHDEKKEIAEKNDLNILKDILKNKQIRKKVRANFKFLRNISEKKFYEFLDEHNTTNKIESLMNKKEKNMLENGKPQLNIPLVQISTKEFLIPSI